MKTYRIIETITGSTLHEKTHRGDVSAKNWLNKLAELGVLTGAPVQLQRRVMTDDEAAKLPPFANGQKQSAWTTI